MCLAKEGREGGDKLISTGPEFYYDSGYKVI